MDKLRDDKERDNFQESVIRSVTTVEHLSPERRYSKIRTQNSSGVVVLQLFYCTEY